MVTPNTECDWNRDRLRGVFGWPASFGKLERRRWNCACGGCAAFRDL